MTKEQEDSLLDDEKHCSARPSPSAPLRQHIAQAIREARARGRMYRSENMIATALIEQGRVCALAELAETPLARKNPETPLR